MKKLILILLVLVCSLTSSVVSAQLTKTLDVSLVSGADTSFWFTFEESKYSYNLGVTAFIENVVGTGASWELLTSPSDTISIVMAGTTRTINSDTAFAITSDITSLERLGFKYTKGSVTAGNLTVFYSRKTRK